MGLAGLAAGAVLGFQSLQRLEARISSQDSLLRRGDARLLDLKRKFSGDAARSSVLLKLHGSNTVGDELAPLLLQGWLASMGGQEARIVRDSLHPEQIAVSARLGSDSARLGVEVLAKGSGTAFENLKAGSCDIGMSSRPIKDKDLEAFESAGILDMAPPSSEHVIALDAIAVVVHPGNPAVSLTLEQVRGIFSGKIVDWSELNVGKSGPIHLLGRDGNSGTQSFFKDVVLGEDDFGEGYKGFSSHVQVASLVMEDPQSIGYVSLPYIAKTKALALRDGSGPPLYPASFAVRSEDYPISRRLYLYLPGQSTNLLAKEFLDFAHSAAGQALVAKSGMVPLEIEVGGGDAKDDSRLPAALREQLRQGERLSSTFRFTATGRLDSRADRDLERLKQILALHPASRLHFVGFSDSTGNPDRDLEVSRELAETVRKAWTTEGGSRNVTAMAAGSWLPMATNRTDAGRLRNRRVEVWITAR